MGGGSGTTKSKSSAKDYPWHYFGASALAALINYPLWRVSAMGQSGFVVPTTTTTTTILKHGPRIPSSLAPYIFALSPPYKGAVATVLGMTWARAAIFYGSDAGRDWLGPQCEQWLLLSHPETTPDFLRNSIPMIAVVVPPLVVSTIVQCINMPIVRATVTIQDPQCTLPNVWAAVRHIYTAHGGLAGLWHGTSAGILKTVPKYCTAIVVKDLMEQYYASVAPRDASATTGTSKRDQLWHSAVKAAAAGMAGAVLTNPLDVIRNEMFKTNQSLVATVRHLHAQHHPPFVWMTRGMSKNVIAVAFPGTSSCLLLPTYYAYHFRGSCWLMRMLSCQSVSLNIHACWVHSIMYY